MDAVELRQATADDAGFISGSSDRLGARSRLAWVPTGFTDAFAAAGCGEAVEAIGKPDEEVRIAVGSEGERLGFVHAKLDRSAFSGEVVGYVSTLVVSGAAERRGVGRALMAAAEEWARGRGCNLITLEVFASNVEARAVYGRLGYAEHTLKLAKPI
jgi:GNAT superfamily N-acetyltransferase